MIENLLKVFPHLRSDRVVTQALYNELYAEHCSKLAECAKYYSFTFVSCVLPFMYFNTLDTTIVVQFKRLEAKNNIYIPHYRGIVFNQLSYPELMTAMKANWFVDDSKTELFYVAGEERIAHPIIAYVEDSKAESVLFELSTQYVG